MEILVVLIIALVVFGPKRLPELGSSLGRGIREFRSTVSGENVYDDRDREAKKLEPPKAEASPVTEQREVVTDKRA
jgi:sec-independent protein translocase protein TatA